LRRVSFFADSVTSFLCLTVPIAPEQQVKRRNSEQHFMRQEFYPPAKVMITAAPVRDGWFGKGHWLHTPIV
jgi:hypothetical protein